jgi:hypothetical protein
MASLGPERSSPTLVTLGVLGAALGATWWLVEMPSWVPLPFSITLVDLLLFAVAAAVMELLPIRQPRGGRPVPSSLAVVGAAAILGAAPPVVALVAAGAWGLARLLDRGPAPVGPLLLRALGGWALAGAAALGAAIGPPTWYGTVDPGMVPASINPGAALAVTIAVVIGLPALETLARAGTQLRFLLRRIGETVASKWLVGIAVASTAVLGALVDPVLGRWTLPTMLIPLLAARVGLDRYAVASRAYDQTIRAMSRLPEQLGTVTAEHGVRVGELARDVALELGLDMATVADVVRAAHLHELGRIKLERDAPVTQRELALAGASVIHEAASMDRVARIVAAHGDLAGREAAEPAIAVPAGIVAACCEIDRYAPDPAEPGQRQEVVVRLVRDVGDLEVVSALTRVLDRR